jgi:two-component system chemotaxis response regulator CheY
VKMILLVDDSPTILMSLKAVLGKAGYGVETATRGQEALDKVKGTLKPNLIICDLNMPQMDGLTLIKQLRQVPSTRFAPILMLTTETEASKRAEAKAAGATGWLVKPVPPDQLLGVIKQVLPGA